MQNNIIVESERNFCTLIEDKWTFQHITPVTHYYIYSSEQLHNGEMHMVEMPSMVTVPTPPVVCTRLLLNVYGRVLLHEHLHTRAPHARHVTINQQHTVRVRMNSTSDILSPTHYIYS